MARPIKDISGEQYGWLTVASLSTNQEKGKHSNWICKCVCGKLIEKPSKYLNKNTKSSCGCKLKETQKMSVKPWNNRLRSCFYSAKSRCEKPSHLTYKDYGAKGIKFNIKNVEELFNHLGNPKDNQTLDRINSTDNYEIGNIRWATLKEQQRNRKDNKWYKYKNELYIAKDLFDMLSPNCSYDCFRARLKRGWSVLRSCE